MSKAFEFKHDYNALKEDVFGAVRGATRAKQYSIGDIIVLNVRGKFFCNAEVVKIEVGTIQDTSIEWCRHLVSHGSFMPKNQRDLMAHLNSIRHPKARLTSVMDEIAVFHLRKVKI